MGMHERLWHEVVIIILLKRHTILVINMFKNAQ